ncbi:hypothetical protein [Halomarina pelagica]|uniref:hypothetical protein n=1 Tax=Halomarina pelagica TaxID=2961599 RepID=UPI0020C2DE3B|nr:hypothetical protein [Halomarina sp. BND7]
MMKPKYPETQGIHRKRCKVMSRRRLMRTLSGLGFSGITASYLTTDDVKAAASDEVPIVVGFHGDDPHAKRTPFVKYIPADWYNDFRHATDVKDRVGHRFSQKNGVVSVGVIPGDAGGENSRISVRIVEDKYHRTASELPDHVDGVEVVPRKSGVPRPTSCSLDDLRNWTNTYIYGGFLVKGDSSERGYGTVSCTGYKNGNSYIITSQHIFNGSDNVGKKLRKADGTLIGEVRYDRCKEDFAATDITNGFGYARAIWDSGYNGIRGNFSYDGLGDLRRNGARPQKVGQRTCRTTTAGITAIASTVYTSFFGCLPKPYSVWLVDNSSSNDYKPGDSGSMSYYESPNNSSYCWLISLCNYEDPDSDDFFGLGCYRMNEFGYQF